jgi:transcriptional regulator GlxA family with amidase domain
MSQNPSFRSKQLDIIVYEGFKSFEAIGPLTVFSCVNRILLARGEPFLYDIRIVAPQCGYVTSDTLMGLYATAALGTGLLPDTCLIVGAPDIIERLEQQPAVVDWIKSNAGDIPRFAALCTGSFFVAEAGLLDGAQATTHWRYADLMSQRYPEIEVVSDAIFLQQQHLWTSAGVSAAIDLCLAFVEQDCGHELALEVARELVIFLRRPGGQSQFSADLSSRLSPLGQIRDVQQWILGNLHLRVDVESLAEKCSMSSRNFRRLFHRETGQCPSEYLERARLDKARRMLCDCELPIKSVAYHCGFASDDQMRLAFKRYLSITPKDYRARFIGQPVGARS